MCLCYSFSAKTAWQLVNRKADFFTKRIDLHNESNRIDSNRELECSSCRSAIDDDSFITAILRSLHWIKLTERIEYKLFSLTYKVLTTT